MIRVGMQSTETGSGHGDPDPEAASPTAGGAVTDG